MKKLLSILIITFFSTISFSQKEIPNITLQTLKGKQKNINDVIKSNKVTVLSFWATWCVPCINELDAISDIYTDWQDETGVEIIAISIDDARTQKRIKPMINGKDWEYKVLIDKNHELKRALNISVIPHVIVVKNGKIVYRHTGYTAGGEDELYEIIKENTN